MQIHHILLLCKELVLILIFGKHPTEGVLYGKGLREEVKRLALSFIYPNPILQKLEILMTASRYPVAGPCISHS